MTKKLSVTEIERMNPRAIKELDGTFIVSSKYVLAVLTAKLRLNKKQYNVNFKELSVEILN